MDRFCGYHHLGCVDCAVWSWSDHASLIEHDHFWVVCPDTYHDWNCYLDVCFCCSDRRTTDVGVRSGSVLFVCVVNLFSPFVWFYCFASESVRHGADHDGLTSCCIFGTKKLEGIHVTYRSIFYLLVLVHEC
jgi:hypothetical protein